MQIASPDIQSFIILTHCTLRPGLVSSVHVAVLPVGQQVVINIFFTEPRSCSSTQTKNRACTNGRNQSESWLCHATRLGWPTLLIVLAVVYLDADLFNIVIESLNWRHPGCDASLWMSMGLQVYISAYNSLSIVLTKASVLFFLLSVFEVDS